MLAGLLLGCAPRLSQVPRPLLSAQASVSGGELVFQITNTSGKPLTTQSTYCPLFEPHWEIKRPDGAVYTAPLPSPMLEGGGIETCVLIYQAKRLAPGEGLTLRRRLNLPPGTFTIRSWVEPGDGRLEAPTITVTIP
ncbi:hypothetical protein [Deinococcus sp.]|uniref:hypothetical protein n=1 Tax=Deinococcus sp. TaxID=47478 RepID=UPI0025DA822D|nr:hypothetical protein [Deinococcus sp.]